MHTAERRTFHIQYMYVDGPQGVGSDKIFKLAEAQQDPRVAPGGGTWRSIGSGVYTIGPKSLNMEKKVFESLKVEKTEGLDPDWGNKVGDYVRFHFRGHETMN